MYVCIQTCIFLKVVKHCLLYLLYKCWTLYGLNIRREVNIVVKENTNVSSIEHSNKFISNPQVYTYLYMYIDVYFYIIYKYVPIL